jgi:ferredoxin--NADP+ reductase
MMTSTWRIAVVGAGPSGLYAANEILRQSTRTTVDLIDRLPTIGGLARAGIAPDHHARRGIIDFYERLNLASGRFRFHGNVVVGSDVSPAQLANIYDAVVYAHGCQGDRRLGIPGEELSGSHSATSFVGWYNGHPDYRDCEFDFDCERAVVIGNGNVALDVARVLLLDPEDLAKTDIADHALDALRRSQVREVVVVGRRGADECSFTTPELLELQNLSIDFVVEHAQFPGRADSADSVGARGFTRDLKCRLLADLAARPLRGGPRMVLRFLTSPLEIIGENKVTSIRLTANRLAIKDGRTVAKPTSEVQELETGLVVRSVGYRGQPIPGLPFDEARAIVPNVSGRVEVTDSEHVERAYVTGWIKRGPQGVIGSNKLCARDTVATMLHDLESATPSAIRASETLTSLMGGRAKQVVDYAGWKRIDRFERNAACGTDRPRVKLTEWPALRDVSCGG